MGRKAAARTVQVLLALGAGLMLAAADDKGERPTPSGLPVPRYVSLKFDEVNARAGPGDDYKALWVYHAKGLPVQVVAETSDWRRICDPEGGLAWVHKRTTDGRRMVIRMQDGDMPIRRKPRDEAKVTAYLRSRALAGLDRCDKGWCKIRAGGAAGWAKEVDLWGVVETPQCR